MTDRLYTDRDLVSDLEIPFQRRGPTVGKALLDKLRRG
jgi:hypothetical protein